METKFTPGPWEFDGESDVFSTREGESLVADVNFPQGRFRTKEELHANGHLIAAAPDLFKIVYHRACSICLYSISERDFARERGTPLPLCTGCDASIGIARRALGQSST